MGFGAEMKDFISAFKTGHSMFKRSAEEKEADEFQNYWRENADDIYNESRDMAALPDARVPTAVVNTDDPDVQATENDEETNATMAYAEGGPVEAIPVRPRRATGRSGEETPTDFILNEADRKNPESLVNEDGASLAMDAGLSWIAKYFGMDKTPAIGDPRRNEMLNRFARGEGAATQEEVAAASNVVDPQRRMSESDRMIAMMWAGYKFFMEKGQPEKAAKYSASLAMYARTRSMMLGNFALAALENGDTDQAARLIQSAYGLVPDGRDIKVRASQNGQIQYEVATAAGKVTRRGTAGPRELAALAQQMANGSAADSALTERGSRGRALRQGSSTEGGGAASTKEAAARAAARELAAAKESGDEEAIAAAQSKYDAAYEDALDEVSSRSYRSGSAREWAIGQFETRMGSLSGNAPTSGGKADPDAALQLASDRRVKGYKQDAKNDLKEFEDNTYDRGRAEAGFEQDRESNAQEAISTARERISLDRAGTRGDQLSNDKGRDKGLSLEDRLTPDGPATAIDEALNGALQRLPAKGQPVDPSKVDPAYRSTLRQVALDIMRNNEAALPEDAANAAVALLATPRLKVNEDNSVSAGGQNVFLGSASLNALNALKERRGKPKPAAPVNTEETAPAKPQGSRMEGLGSAIPEPQRTSQVVPEDREPPPATEDEEDAPSPQMQDWMSKYAGLIDKVDDEADSSMVA